jgi:hypothetical protein
MRLDFPARDANPRKWNENAFFLSNDRNPLGDRFTKRREANAHETKKPGGQVPARF